MKHDSLTKQVVHAWSSQSLNNRSIDDPPCGLWELPMDGLVLCVNSNYLKRISVTQVRNFNNSYTSQTSQFGFTRKLEIYMRMSMRVHCSINWWPPPLGQFSKWWLMPSKYLRAVPASIILISSYRLFLKYKLRLISLRLYYIWE